MPRRNYGVLAATIRAEAERLGYKDRDLDERRDIARNIAAELKDVDVGYVQRILRVGNKPGRPPAHTCTCPTCGREHKPMTRET